MDENSPQRHKMRSYTVAALLGIFVVATLLALASRLLPGSLSRLAQRALRREDHDRGDPRGA
jgi:hypothetical protein